MALNILGKSVYTTEQLSQKILRTGHGSGTIRRLVYYIVLKATVQCLTTTIFFAKYSTWPAELCEHRLFKAHHRTDVHQKKTVSVETGQQRIKSTSLIQSLEDPQIWTRIQVVHTLAANDVAIDQFGDMLDSHLICAGYQPARHYRDDRAAWEIAVMISQYLRRLLKERLAESPYYDIMIDETTDISTMSNTLKSIRRITHSL